ncbi:MAG TPA: sugar kinase [Candidatus Marinimicrobia bacterium]|nr:sugar kinase [Candidatus Neomarinimicrobiota bacterium]
MSVVVVGSIALDSVETPWGKRENALGGSATYFSLACSRFSKTRIVGIAGTDFPEKGLDLFRRHNIDTEGLKIVEGKTFRWGGRYKSNLNKRDTIYTELNVFEKFQPQLPRSYRQQPMLFLGNIHPELQLDVLSQMERKPLVGLDTMNLWIDISREKVIEALQKVDIVIMNEDEIRQLTVTSNVYEAARRLIKLGPSTLVVKRGEYGAFLCHHNEMFSVPAFPVSRVIDPTGAGDAFAGGFFGFLGKFSNPRAADYRRAMVYGTILASFLVESFSTDTIDSIIDEEIENRAKELIKIITL